MDVKTKISDKILKEILVDYDIGKFKSFKYFKKGYVQTNILINTTKGKYVLRFYENRNKQRIDFEISLLNFLDKNNYTVAKPIINIKKKYIGFFNKKPFVIFSYIKGKHLKNLNEIQFKELVHKLALLHKLTKNYDTNKFVHKEPRTKEFCLNTAKKEKKRFKNKEKGDLRFNKIKTELEKLILPENLTKGIIHGDYDKSNIKFNGNSISGILDFDDSHYGYKIHDLSILILYWAIFYPKKIKFDVAKIIVKYYEDQYPLTVKEKQSLFDFIKFSGLIIMSFLMYDKWKGKDLFSILSKFIDELNKIGRTEFYNKVFK